MPAGGVQDLREKRELLRRKNRLDLMRAIEDAQLAAAERDQKFRAEVQRRREQAQQQTAQAQQRSEQGATPKGPLIPPQQTNAQRPQSNVGPPADVEETLQVGGAEGGAGAQRVLQDRINAAQGAVQSIIPQRDISTTTVPQNVAPGVFLPVQRTQERVSLRPNVVTAGQALQSIQFDIEQARKHRLAASAVGKVFQDLRSGVLPPEMAGAALQAALREGTTTINLTQGTRTEVEKELLAASRARDRLLGVQRALTPELVGYEARLRAAGLSFQSKIGNLPFIGRVLGPLTPEQQRFLTRHRRLAGRLSEDLTLVLSDLSGATVSPTEADRFGEFRIRPSDSFEEINAKLTNLYLTADYALARGQIWQMGQPTQRPWQITRTEVETQIANSYRKAYEQLATDNPGAAPADVAAGATEKVEAFFNLMPGGAQRILNEMRGLQ